MDPSAPVDPSTDPSEGTTPTADNLPGFCPSDISADTDTQNGSGSGDCRCGSSLGLQAADAETDAVQPLAAAPDWGSGGNCGCLWGQNQCGCYDGTSGSDGVGVFFAPLVEELGLGLGCGGALLGQALCTRLMTDLM